jgi:polysaccharide pyruvyl transferase WcaK-like protein
MKTLLVGNFGAHNVGDELILSAALQDYPTAVVMTANAKSSETFCETKFKTVPFPPTAFRSLGRYLINSDYRNEVHKIKHFDQVVFAGGGLFAISIRACLLWFLVFKWLKFLNPTAEFRFEYQGVDEGLNGMSKKLTQWVFSQADFISVRDENSKLALVKLGVTVMTLTEDRVWLWLHKLDLSHDFKFDSQETNKLVLVNAIDYCHGEIFRVEHKQNHHPVKFVAFSPQDLKYVPLGVDAILPKNKTQVFELFSSAHEAVGERLHFLIVAQVFADNRGTVSLLRKPYAEKVKSFTQTHNINRFELT